MKECVEQKEFTEEWKIRLLPEYRNLIERRTKAQKYLENKAKSNLSNNKDDDLLIKQIQIMMEYEEILCSRIINLL